MAVSAGTGIVATGVGPTFNDGPGATGNATGPSAPFPCQRLRRAVRSVTTARAAFAPFAPVIPPPGCVPAPHR